MSRTPLGVAVGLLALIVLAMTAPVAAHDYDRDDSDYPLRYVAYVFHPIGIGLEYGVTRPIHWLVSQPNLRIVFGHAPRHELNERGQYPVCNLCKPGPLVVECPRCHKKILKPRDEYWTWR